MSSYTHPGHQRTGKLSTPAARIIELTSRLVLAERELELARAEIERFERSPDRWHSFSGTSFAGVAMAQFWAELILWESLLNDQEYDAIVEIGTFTGGLSLWLHAQARARDIIFRTYDVRTPVRKIPGFVKLDVFAEAEAVGEHLRRHEPVIVLCDGGNKPRELKTFSRYLSPRSTLVVHDWGSEFLETDIPNNVVMVHRRLCEDLGSVSRVFKVRDE
jgi:hypothetical protein